MSGKAVSRRDTMAQRRQRGWLKKENRIQGETWVLYFRTTRKSDGRRVENKIPIGLLRDLPDKRTALLKSSDCISRSIQWIRDGVSHLLTWRCTTLNTSWLSVQNPSIQKRIQP
jgi:hypothetical protein